MTEHETGARRGLPGEGTGMTPPPPGFEQPQQVDRLSIREREGDHSCGYRDGIRRVHAALDEAGRPGADTWPAATRVQRLLTDHRGAVSLLEQARYCVTYALNCPAHPWHGSDEARKWLIEAARLGGQ